MASRTISRPQIVSHAPMRRAAAAASAADRLAMPFETFCLHAAEFLGAPR